MRDLRLLFWLRWRQFREDAVYWLRTVGYEPGNHSLSQRLYVVYLILIGLFWLGSMLSWGYDQASLWGRLLTREALDSWLLALPWAVLVLQVGAVAFALRSTPLKLSFADIAYVAGSPVDRAAPVIFGYLRQVMLRLIVLGALAALVGVLLVAPVNAAGRAAAGLRGFIAAAPLVVLTWALAWVLGLLRLMVPRIRELRYVWLLPLLLLAIAYVLPDVALWPGRVLLLVIYGQPQGWLPLLLITGGALALVALLFRLGDRINMIHATDESIVYARIKALGLMAWRDPRLQLRIYGQTARARRRAWLRLPHAYGFAGLAARAALTFARHPLMLFTTALWGAAMTYVAVIIITNQLPVQLWLGWLLVAGFVPPIGLLYVFRADLEERFLRQFVLMDHLRLLAADALLPLAALILGALSAWLLQGFPAEISIIGVVFIVLLSLLLALSGAAALSNRRVLLARVLITAFSFGAVVVAGNSLGLMAALVAAGFISLLLAGVVAGEG
ncbi:MAG: hypothetical protein HZC41_11605 [Chloroflexi bacterium]|nr:hypothetical protein [Chloroflexota bacterium]